MWQTTNRIPQQNIQEQVEKNIPKQSEENQAIIDSDIRSWQIKETEFFSARFPKEWFWVEPFESTPFSLGAIANVNLESKMVLNPGNLYKSGYKGILVLFTGIAPTSNLIANTDKTLSEAVDEFFHDWESRQENKTCTRIDTTSEYILKCSDDSSGVIMAYDYLIIGSRNQLFLTIFTDADSVLDGKVFDAITENIHTK